jgi:Protein of unknown function (DUF2750)
LTESHNQSRYWDLIATVQSTKSLWIAESDDSVLILTDATGDELILVWPTAECARAVLSQRPDIAYFKPASRTLDQWIGVSTRNLSQDGVLVAAHPDNSLSCLKVSAKIFARDLLLVPQLQGADISRIKRKVANRKR